MIWVVDGSEGKGKCHLHKALKHTHSYASQFNHWNLMFTHTPLNVYTLECKQFGVCITCDDWFKTSNLPMITRCIKNYPAFNFSPSSSEQFGEHWVMIWQTIELEANQFSESQSCDR